MIKEFILSKRRCGHTEYMLRAAVNNPEVIIVVATESHIGALVRRYNKLISEQPWYKRIWWRITNRRSPRFVSIRNAHSSCDGICEPVMFDNACFLT